jgi:hypothetical protein
MIPTAKAFLTANLRLFALIVPTFSYLLGDRRGLAGWKASKLERLYRQRKFRVSGLGVNPRLGFLNPCRILS